MKSKESIEEVFQRIMENVKINHVAHLMFFINEKGFVADINTEDNSMYFSYLQSWHIFREDYKMADDAICEFLSEMVNKHFGYTIKPY